MKKRVAAAFLAVSLFMVPVLSACSDSGSTADAGTSDSTSQAPGAEASAASGEPESDTIVVGMSIDTTNQAWRAGLVRDVTEEAAKHPEVELIVTDAQGNGSKQISDVEDLITRGVDCIMISPYEGQTLSPICAQAYQAGIPVLVLDRELPGDQFTSFIGADNRSIGKQAGEFILKYMQENNKTKFVEIQGLPGSATCTDRSEPVIEALSQDPSIEIVAQQAANWDENEALQVTENLLQAYPEGSIDVIYVQCDPMALGVLKALRSADRMEIDIISIDGQKQVLEAIQKDEIVTTFTYPFPGAEGVRTAIKVAKGEKVPAKIDIPTTQIDKANVDEHYNPDAAF